MQATGHMAVESTLFVDIGVEAGTPAEHLAHAAVLLTPFAFAPPGAANRTAGLDSKTAPLYSHCFAGVLSSVAKCGLNALPDMLSASPGPKTDALVALGATGYAAMLLGLCHTHKAEVDLIDQSWRAVKFKPRPDPSAVQKLPRRSTAVMLGVDPKARSTYSSESAVGGATTSATQGLAGQLASGPEINKRLEQKGGSGEGQFAYDSATGKVRDVGRQRMCPVFLELQGHLKMMVLALEPTMVGMDVVKMLFKKNNLALQDEDYEVGGLEKH
jgi:hypothetical protein